MKILNLAAAAAALTVWSASAQADIHTDLANLSWKLDDQLCRDSADPYYCVEPFSGAFGSSDDQFQPPPKRNRERDNNKHDLTCDTSEDAHPIEDPHCNATNSKAEWRHDSLKLKLQSADQEYAKGRDAAGNIYLCALAADADAMYADGKLDAEGYEIIVEQGIDMIIEWFEIVCDE